MKKDTTLKLIVTDAIIKSRFVRTDAELERLLDITVGKLRTNFKNRDKLLSEKEVTDRFPLLTADRLTRMRDQGRGPDYVLTGRSDGVNPRYRLIDLEDWILQHYITRPLRRTMSTRGAAS